MTADLEQQALLAAYEDNLKPVESWRTSRGIYDNKREAIFDLVRRDLETCWEAQTKDCSYSTGGSVCDFEDTMKFLTQNRDLIELYLSLEEPS